MKSIQKISFLLILSLLVIMACNSSGEPDGSMSIKYNELRQEIDGFGGSDAWARLPENPHVAAELARLLYSKKDGMGFTILRTRIPFRERLQGDDNPGYNDGFVVRNSDNTYRYTVNEDGTKTFTLNWNGWDMANSKKLIDLIKSLGDDGPENLTVFSTPWTPPNNRVTRWKENVTGVSSKLDYEIDWSKPDIWGRLRRDKYNDYADLLADFVLNFESNMGAPLNILSIQNEPNYKVEYESAYWSGEDLRDFIKTIAVRFPMKNIELDSLGIMAPEFENFDIDFNAMIKPMLDDPISENILTHIALHQYNSGYDSSVRAGSKEFPGIIASGKKFWQTEVSGSGPHLPTGNGIDNAMHYARMIHFNMTLAETNAFLFWWLWQVNPQNQLFPGSLLMTDHSRLVDSLRLYAMGQYSRFIRPGWHRIEAAASPIRGRAVYSSAYRSPSTGEVAVVIINDTIGDYTISLDLEGADFSRLDIWRTSAEEKLKSAGRQRVSGNKANVKIAPKSITTFYGRVKQ
ncbi:MAG: hypothetical protein LBU88_08035 [Treponema sp.]|jgi:O-glycosyl hydrolase|nr:hypothetical protein [Treponema sp.]